MANQPNSAIGEVDRSASTQPSPSDPIGKPMSRVDGRLKVTGAARYAADAPTENVLHAVLLSATIAKGTIAKMDVAAARAARGVRLVVTADNMPKLGDPADGLPPMMKSLVAETRRPMSDTIIHHAGQHIACVVADTIDRARAAARMIHVAYTPSPPDIHLHDANIKEDRPSQNMGEPLQLNRGDVEKALTADGLTRVEQTYFTPVETHNPMELHASVAAWSDDKSQLTIWDATQYLSGMQGQLAAVFGLHPRQVRVICPFVGGGFGCKGSGWSHTFIAAAVARLVGRPVKLMLTRQQMFGSVGHRPETQQAITLAASKADQKLVALRHDTTMQGSEINTFIEPCAMGTSRLLYATPSLQAAHIVKRVNIAPPTFMRAPGEASGMFALESAMDELAEALNVDPVQLRVTNHADANPDNGSVWSSKHLLECYRLGAEKFGWSKRDAKPGSSKSADGRAMGWGMATATYPGYRFPSAVRLRIMADPQGGIRANGASAVHDLGTGAYTVATQMLASVMGLPTARVRFEMGDSSFPPGTVAGGSTTTASLAAAIGVAADELKKSLLKLADMPSVNPKQIRFRDGLMVVDSDAGQRSVELRPLVEKQSKSFIEVVGQGEPEMRKDVTFHSFGTHFVEVVIDHPVPRVCVKRVVSVMNVGTIINPKTARSQVLGGVVMGIGMALMEHTAYDPRTGRPVTDNLADYAVPTNPDIPLIETYFVEEPDYQFNSLGCRGVGEIGITGVAAAIANAVYHATGQRVRDLPITPDKLLTGVRV